MFYQLYFDPYTKFNGLVFYELNVLESFNSKNLPMTWCTILNGEELDCLVIEFVGYKCCPPMLFYNRFFETYVKAIFPFGDSSCEIKL